MTFARASESLTRTRDVSGLSLLSLARGRQSPFVSWGWITGSNTAVIIVRLDTGRFEASATARSGLGEIGAEQFEGS